MLAYLKLIRVHQWVKNLFLFIPPFFAGQIFNFEIYPSLILGFFSFCLVASAIYVINDMKDVESDRMHPEKKRRPLASGRISIQMAWFAMALCLIIGFSLATFSGNYYFMFILGFYFLMNLGYTFYLKRISILDITIVAIGFLLRIFSGGVLTGVEISGWLVIMIFLLALFIAFAKRRDDLLILAEEGKTMRVSLKGYNLEFVNGSLYLVSAVIIVTYISYTLSPDVISKHESKYLFLSSFFVVIGLLRYLQITLVEQKSGNPTNILLKDRFIQGVIVGWALTIYFLFV